MFVHNKVILDVSPPPLSTLLLDGGHLIFQHDGSASAAKLSLQATHILVVNFGSMVAGSETEPFTRPLEITLLGNRSASKELPQFGAKGGDISPLPTSLDCTCCCPLSHPACSIHT